MKLTALSKYEKLQKAKAPEFSNEFQMAVDDVEQPCDLNFLSTEPSKNLWSHSV